FRSLNASSADAVTVSGVPGGSGSYIQNATTQQASANFNISGNGTAGGTLSGNIVNATTQYNIGGARFASMPGNANLFAGLSAGQANTSGFSNAFFGHKAGEKNQSGSDNSFFGYSAGADNTTGASNAFFGRYAGFGNTTGSNNTMIGDSAGMIFANISNATAIGANARVAASNSLVLGSMNGSGEGTADTDGGS